MLVRERKLGLKSMALEEKEFGMAVNPKLLEPPPRSSGVTVAKRILLCVSLSLEFWQALSFGIDISVAFGSTGLGISGWVIAWVI
jgi:hypothetical protein